jgi:DNA-binding LytR/AlgR family response regulator
MMKTDARAASVTLNKYGQNFKFWMKQKMEKKPYNWLKSTDLIFLDIRMPIKTGLEAAQEIGNKAHIVFITAYDQYAIQAFDHGAVDYVLKPADVERLSKTVERLKSRLKANTISQQT